MTFYPINRVERIKELRRVLTDRWGPRLPNDDTGRRLLSIVIDHARLIEGDLAERMALQLLPDITDAELAFMIDRAGAGNMWGPRALAYALGLPEATRVRLQITTIAAVDCTRNQRKKRRRQIAKLNAAADGHPTLHINQAFAYDYASSPAIGR